MSTGAPLGFLSPRDRTAAPSAGKRIRERYTREERLDFDPMEERADDPTGDKTKRPFPFRLAEETQILGMVLDRHASLAGHYALVLTQSMPMAGHIAACLPYYLGP